MAEVSRNWLARKPANPADSIVYVTAGNMLCRRLRDRDATGFRPLVRGEVCFRIETRPLVALVGYERCRQFRSRCLGKGTSCNEWSDCSLGRQPRVFKELGEHFRQEVEIFGRFDRQAEVDEEEGRQESRQKGEEVRQSLKPRIASQK